MRYRIVHARRGDRMKVIKFVIALVIALFLGLIYWIAFLENSPQR
jgi:hypothetical protein